MTSPSSTRRRARITTAAVAVMIAAGVATGPVSSALASAARPVTASTSVVVCNGETAKQPATVNAWCASGDLVWRRLHWRDWGTTRATAVGMQERNSTDSAAGPIRSTRVRLVLSHPVTTHGSHLYTTLTVQRLDGHHRAVEYRATDDGFVRIHRR